jgi:hypothetical protein
MQQIARRFLLLENYSMLSAQWRPGVSAGISTLTRIRLTLNGRDIPFVNSAKYLGVNFDGKVTWRLHIEMI